MKSIRKKREKEFQRIIKDLWRMRRNHDNNIQQICYDYLYMKVKQLQKKGLLFNIEIPEKIND